MKSDEVLYNSRALEAASDPVKKEAFLETEQLHILRLAGKVLGRSITRSDDEYSIALMAVAEAIDSYDDGKGNFWTYAALVIKSRTYDWYKTQAHQSGNEVIVRPEAFYGEIRDLETESAVEREVSSKAAVDSGSSIQDEIEAFTQQLNEYGIDLFELAEVSPKSQKTKAKCREAIAAMFSPPPLTGLLHRAKRLPMTEIRERTKLSQKLLDRHRKYLVAGTLILEGDYPNLQEYIPVDLPKEV
jgi:RNA polymerase sigma factor